MTITHPNRIAYAAIKSVARYTEMTFFVLALLVCVYLSLSNELFLLSFYFFLSEMAPRRHCILNATLQKEFPFLRTTEIKSDVYCDICSSKFSIGAGGRSDIKRHVEAGKHQLAVNARASTPKVTTYFSSSSDLTTAAREGVYAYHVAKTNHSFNPCDCESKIFRKCFEMKTFYCGRTKCHAIVTNVFAPYIIEEIKSDLLNANHLTVTTDASNHGNIKLMPVLARFFIPTSGIRVKILEFSSQKGETSQIIANLIMKTADEFQIKNKIVAFCGDNAAANFGSVQRGGQNNAYYHLKQWKKSLIGIGCAAHIAHNALKFACDAMPIDVECIVVKIYAHFYIYTVRIEELKELCSEMDDVEYKKLLGYAKTRFLAMAPAIGRILNLFEALKLYFLNLKGESTIKTFFRNPSSKLWLIFIKEQVSQPLVNDE